MSDNEKRPMTDPEYAEAQAALLLVANLLTAHDWSAFIGRIASAESTAFLFVAPFDYQRATERFKHLRGMANNARGIVQCLGELNDCVRKQQANQQATA